jgi:hypothetical protein
MARLPDIPARDRREEQDVGPVGAAQARKPQTGVFQTAGAGFGDAYDFSNSGISGREQDQFL